MACDERVGWAASGAEIYTPKFIAVQMGGVNGIVQHGQQDLVVIGVERRARGKALDDFTARRELHVATVGRLPALARSQENGKVAVRLVFRLPGRNALRKHAIPSNLAGPIEGNRNSHRICVEQRERGKEVPVACGAGHVQTYIAEERRQVSGGQAERVRDDADP